MGNSNKKQCIVFIDDREAVNQCQAQCLAKLINPNSDCSSENGQSKNFEGSSDDTASYPRQTGFYQCQIEKGRAVDLILLHVCLKPEDETMNAKAKNEQTMDNVCVTLNDLKLKEQYATVLPVVDVCLARSITDSAWNIKDFITFFGKLDKLPIKLLVSGNAMALNQEDFNSLTNDYNTLFVPRPSEKKVDNKIEFVEDESWQSTVEDRYLSNILEKYKDSHSEKYQKFIAAEKVQNFLKGLIKAGTKYYRFFYTILVANEILYYFQ